MDIPAICFLLCVVSIVHGDANKCDRIVALAAWKDHNTIVETTFRTLTGTWISEGRFFWNRRCKTNISSSLHCENNNRIFMLGNTHELCETRPGPEYILRSYTFTSDGTYSLVQHHYFDDSCATSKLTILSHGRVLLRNSLVQPDACSAQMKVVNITVIPHDKLAAKELDDVVAIECPDTKWKHWKVHQEHLVYDNKLEKKTNFNLWFTSSYQQPPINYHQQNQSLFGNIECLGSLKSSFNELKLIKVQFRPTTDDTKKTAKVEAELFLGDIHSNAKHREFYTPTSFQTAPLHRDRSENITLNNQTYRIQNSRKVPTNVKGRVLPHLNQKPHLPPYVYGDWVSMRCEVRPLGLYLTRRFSFYSADSTWVGEHNFYSDPFCTYPKFIVTAAGHFVLEGRMKGITNIDFHIEKATLTLLDQLMIHEIKLTGFCGLDEWKVDVPKDLTPTNGCLYLGIILPSVQYDIVKVEIDYGGGWLLFLGQVDTNNYPSISDDRPTAFQSPMVKCGDIMSYSEELHEILSDNLYNNAHVPYHELSLFIFVLLLIVRR